MQIEHDIPYREAIGYDQALATLDIYFEPIPLWQGKRTIVVFVHGGDWVAGDKTCVLEASAQSLPGWFVERGYVFVAVNFRLAGNPRSPGAGIAEMASDIAKAIKWLTVNGRLYGGRSSGLVLLGHSSGAHLATLVATHPRFLQRESLAPRPRVLRNYRSDTNVLLGVVALDVPHFDVPLAIRILETEDTGLPDQARRLAALHKLFGTERANQERLSPADQLGPWLAGTSFLLISTGRQHGSRQWLTQRMSGHFATRLLTAGVRAEHEHLEGWKHLDLIEHFGGELAARIERFLNSLTASAPGAGR